MFVLFVSLFVLVDWLVGCRPWRSTGRQSLLVQVSASFCFLGGPGDGKTWRFVCFWVAFDMYKVDLAWSFSLDFLFEMLLVIFKSLIKA